LKVYRCEYLFNHKVHGGSTEDTESVGVNSLCIGVRETSEGFRL